MYAFSPYLVSSPDPTLCEGKGLVTIAGFLVCADSAVLISRKPIRLQVLNMSFDNYISTRARTIDTRSRIAYISRNHYLARAKTRSVCLCRRFDSVKLTKAVEDSVRVLGYERSEQLDVIMKFLDVFVSLPSTYWWRKELVL